MKKIIMISILMFCLCACQKENTTSPPACEIGSECETIENASDNLMWDKVSLEESLSLLDKDGILFYSFDDCPYCKEARPILEKIKTGLNITYVDVKKEERDVNNQTYQKVYGSLKSLLEEKGYDKIYMPTVLVIKDGKMKLHVGTVNDHDPAVKDMTLEQQNRLEKIYLELIKE